MEIHIKIHILTLVLVTSICWLVLKDTAFLAQKTPTMSESKVDPSAAPSLGTKFWDFKRRRMKTSSSSSSNSYQNLILYSASKCKQPKHFLRNVNSVRVAPRRPVLPSPLHHLAPATAKNDHDLHIRPTQARHTRRDRVPLPLLLDHMVFIPLRALILLEVSP